MRPRMRFLIDENVADAVRRCISGHGYETLVARDVFETGAPDEMLAFAVEQNGLILVSRTTKTSKISNEPCRKVSVPESPMEPAGFC